MIKTKRLVNKTLAVLVVFTLVLFPILNGTVVANTLTTPQGSITTVTPEVASNFIPKVLNLSQFQELTRKYEFDHANTLAQKVTANGIDVISVCVPIKDNTGDNYSRYIAMYDLDGNYIDSILFAFNKVGNAYDFIVQNDHIKAEASIAQNGTILKGLLTDEQGQQHDLVSVMKDKDIEKNKTTNPLLSLLSPTQANAGWFDCFGHCLSQQNVPQYVITGVSIACGVICVVSVGSLCVQCVLVALAGWGSVGLTCAGHCWGWY